MNRLANTAAIHEIYTLTRDIHAIHKTQLSSLEGCHVKMVALALLRASRESRRARSSTVQRHLGGTTTHQAGELDAAAKLPLGQLLGGDGVGVAASVEARDEGRGARVAAADVEGPADEGAVLVGVEDDVGARVAGDAVLGDLLFPAC